MIRPVAALLLLLALAVPLSLLAGRVWLDPWTTPNAAVILGELRLPRALLAVIVGGGLGAAGAAMQGYLRNPLADPGLFGIAPGAALGAVISLLFGYATSGWLLPLFALVGAAGAMLLLALMTIPFFTSYLIRSFSWRLVLGRTGAINETLQALHITSAPLDWLLFSNFAVFIGFIASYLPFAVFPLLLSMRRVPPELMAAARDLGAGFWRAFFTVLVPMTYAGLFAGFLFVFVMVAGSSTEVQMLGGAGASIVSVMINDVMRVANYPLAFAISVVMLVTIFGMVLIGNAFFKLSGLFGEGAE